jgi:hypothetical protein
MQNRFHNELVQQAKAFQKQKAEADKVMLKNLAATQISQTQQLEAARKSKQDSIRKCRDEIERQSIEFEKLVKEKVTEALE